MAETTTTTTTTLFVEPIPYCTFPLPSDRYTWIPQVVLDDGSFLSFSNGEVLKRWLIDIEDDGKVEVRLVGTYVGCEAYIRSAVEIDSSTFVTRGSDGSVCKWDKTTSECLCTTGGLGVYCLIRTNDRSRIACGRLDGCVDMRRVGDLGVISSFSIHSGSVYCICELEDGTFVSASDGGMVKRWDANGTVIQCFSRHSDPVVSLMEFSKSDIIVASRQESMTFWKVSTGQLLHTVKTTNCSVMKLSKDRFVTGSADRTISVWDSTTGECIETIMTGYRIDTIARVKDSILTIGPDLIELRRLRYKLCTTSALTTTLSLSLFTLCSCSDIEIKTLTITTTKKDQTHRTLLCDDSHQQGSLQCR